MTDKEFIKNLLIDIDIDDESSEFLLKYLSAWMNDEGIDLNAKTIKLLKQNEDNINRLKILYSKGKILDIIERKILLSEIARGEKTIQQGRITKYGIEYVNVEPTFNERISAINVLNALDSLEGAEIGEEKTVILDDIRGE